MDEVVPGVLQHMQASDILRKAGLTVASLGQEYARQGVVQATIRRGSQLSGIVDMSRVIHKDGAKGTLETNSAENAGNRCSVEIEIPGKNEWVYSCSCHPDTDRICPHIAALLYHWLAQPSAFVLSPEAPSSSETKRDEPVSIQEASNEVTLTSPLSGATRPGPFLPMRQALTTQESIGDILTSLSLSDLRGIAREYEITTSGLSKQQLLEAILTALKQPELIRRMVGKLEKPQRQLLATLTLAGGSMTDDDLRSLFERFSFGSPDKLHNGLVVLQKKGLMFHVNLTTPNSVRTGLNSPLMDLGWFVPDEVRLALPVSVPITTIDVEHTSEEDGAVPVIEVVEPYSILLDLLLVARALHGYRLEASEIAERPKRTTRPLSTFTASRPSALLPYESTDTIPAPPGIPSPSVLETLEKLVPASPAFLRFALNLLQQADVVHEEESNGAMHLQALPHATSLFLGTAHEQVLRDLFSLWLTRVGYEELYELQEEGLRIRCRTTPLNLPALRTGELEMENSEALQWLVRLLGHTPANQWVSFLAFARFVYKLNPLFLQRRQRMFPSPHWWIEQEDGRTLNPLNSHDWLRAEGRYISRLLRGPLHWWGITDLAYGNDGRLLAFRLTPLARWPLNGMEASLPVSESEPGQRLIEVSERGDLLVACTFEAWPVIQLIEDFAHMAGISDGRLCYQLAPASLSKGLSAGKRPDAMLEQLWALARQEKDSHLERVLVQVEQWIQSYGQVRLYTGVELLEVADALVMRELAATTSIEEHIVRQIQPTLMVVRKQGMERVIEEMKRRGQTPLVHEEEYYGAE